ncbi:MAG: hypothetical protein NC397_01905 [Clostridium sp.]|nr:hypothetical protein [Clostridium sp.]
MAKTIPMIITNNNILVKDKENQGFKPFNMPAVNPVPNIPFYHQFAEKIAEGQYYFKEFMKELYGKKLSKYIFAIIVPDDTTKLESIFLNEFFVNSGACKAVAQMPMSLALNKEKDRYISISKTQRNIVLEYIRDKEIVVKKSYDIKDYNPAQIIADANVIHIDVEYNDVPIYINNFNMNMEDFTEAGEIVSKKQFMENLSTLDVEKL